MKQLISRSVLLLFTIIFLSSCAPRASQSEHKAPQLPPDNSSAELNRIKSLVGRWTSKTSMFGKTDEVVYTEYSITAGGSAVLERIFPGTPQEMVSVYYDDDNGKLAMTHYCMMRNRPTFTLISSSKDTLELDVVRVEGVKSADAPSMGALTLKFEDQNSFSSTCKGRGKGQEHSEPVTMKYTRSN